jgi:hypothetical protein
MVEDVIFTPEADNDSTGDSIIIYFIFHCSQDPGKWRQRID